MTWLLLVLYLIIGLLICRTEYGSRIEEHGSYRNTPHIHIVVMWPMYAAVLVAYIGVQLISLLVQYKIHGKK